MLITKAHMSKNQILSGIQPSGIPTLGNYIGAVHNWLELQGKYPGSLFMIADLHALTIHQSAEKFIDQTYTMAAFLLAAGIDPKKSLVFLQSQVPAHADLGWVMTTQATMGELSRMTQYKTIAQNLKDNIGAGLFVYPALMAADILLYKATHVPVGEDQKQHVELARDLAEKFNRHYGETFIVPEPLISKTGARIMALDDPTQKMSKSSDRDKSYILVTDEPEVIRKKITSATTDSGSSVVFDPARPGLYNLLTIYKSLSGLDEKEIEKKFAGQGYGTFKEALADLVIAELAPIKTKMDEYLNDRKKLDKVLADGAKKAAALAAPTLLETKQKLGLIV
jgi:tryptophanyl-tRNA synthetase